MRVKEVFERAVALQPAEREAYLRSACADDATLRAEVDRVLAADAEAGDFLESPLPLDTTATGVQNGDDLMIGRRIGQFCVERLVGAGGMGTVYQATQDKPRRSVALKVLRADCVRPDAISRFVHESEILARMRHPHIAQVFEAGTFTEGRLSLPYFAMEYLPNAKPITQYAGASTLRQKLNLFTRVCQAVQYGHQRGVIHRDLKPANILVVEEDEAGRNAAAANPQPKIIDFGVARIARPDADVTAMHTQTGTYMGTPKYMSPEQCLAEADIDTRSDVYALGVVLFELLTEVLPYEVSHVPPFEIPRVIRETEPRRPSSIRRALRGDLETIVLKALEKDRERRYQSVAALEEDIQRFLRGDAIEAKADRRWYVLRKTLHRHRAAASAIAVVLIASVTAAVVSTSFWRRSEHDRERLAAAVTELEMQQAETAAALERATESERLARDRLSEMTSYAREKLAELRDSLGPEHDMTLKSMYDLSMLLKRQGALTEVEAIAREAIVIFEERLGREHPTTLRLIGGLASNLQEQDKFDEAESLRKECLDTRRRIFGEDDQETLVSMNNYGLLLTRMKRYEDAEAILTECLERRERVLGPSHSGTLSTMNNLANSYKSQMRFDAAERLYRRVLDVRTETLGPLNTKTIISAHNLGELYRRSDRPADGESYLREAYEAASRVLPEGHWYTAMFASHLGRCLMAMGELDEAKTYLLEGYEGLSRALGADHSRTQSSLRALVDYYEASGQADEADSLRAFIRVADASEED